MYEKSLSLHKSPRHIILVITEMNVIISYKNHPKIIPVFISRRSLGGLQAG